MGGIMQGIYLIEDGKWRRPRSKKEIKGWNPREIVIEATSVFGDEWEGPASLMPGDRRMYFVGPDPYRSRRFYGTIERVAGKVVVK
jgi:hypothetical protein